jgi:hypothetical protein
LADDLLHAHTASLAYVPRAKRCKLAFVDCGDGPIETILRTTSPTGAEPQRCEGFKDVLAMVGLTDCPLTNEQVTTITAICRALRIPPGGRGRVIKWRGLRPEIADRLEPLLRALPRTAGQREALQAIRESEPGEEPVGRVPAESTMYPMQRPSVDERLAEVV